MLSPSLVMMMMLLLAIAFCLRLAGVEAAIREEPQPNYVPPSFSYANMARNPQQSAHPHHHQQSVWPPPQQQQQQAFSYAQAALNGNDGADGRRQQRMPTNRVAENVATQKRQRLATSGTTFDDAIAHEEQQPRQKTKWQKFVRDAQLPEHVLAQERDEHCPGGKENAAIAAEFCAHFARFGWPTEDPLIWKEDFLISYNQRTRLANWVLERITTGSVWHNRQRVAREEQFHTEEQLDKMFAATEEGDYTQLYRTHNLLFPMNHGHLAPAMDHWTDAPKMYATFSLANVAPQSTLLNSGAWNWIERRARQIVLNGLNESHHQQEQLLYRLPSERSPMCVRACPSAYIYTGPLALPKTNGGAGTAYQQQAAAVEYQTIGDHNVAIPTHFFKVLLIQTEAGVRIESYVLPNRPMEEHELLSNIHLYKRPFPESAINFDLLPNLQTLLRGTQGEQIWGARLPETINEFWAKFGRPVDHKIHSSSTDGHNPMHYYYYSCNGHMNLPTWKLELITTRNNNNGSLSSTYGKDGEAAGNAGGWCSPQMEMGQIGRQIDEEMRKLAHKTGAHIFAYSGPLFTPSNGEVKFKVHKLLTASKRMFYAAEAHQFFKVYIIEMHGSDDLLQAQPELKAYKFQRNSMAPDNGGLLRFKRFETSLEDIERISGIQLRKRVEQQQKPPHIDGGDQAMDANWQQSHHFHHHRAAAAAVDDARKKNARTWSASIEQQNNNNNNKWIRGRAR